MNKGRAKADEREMRVVVQNGAVHPAAGTRRMAVKGEEVQVGCRGISRTRISDRQRSSSWDFDNKPLAVRARGVLRDVEQLARCLTPRASSVNSKRPGSLAVAEKSILARAASPVLCGSHVAATTKTSPALQIYRDKALSRTTSFGRKSTSCRPNTIVASNSPLDARISRRRSGDKAIVVVKPSPLSGKAAKSSPVVQISSRMSSLRLSSSADDDQDQGLSSIQSSLHGRLSMLEGRVSQMAAELRETKELLDASNPISSLLLTDIHSKIINIEKCMTGSPVETATTRPSRLSSSSTDSASLRERILLEKEAFRKALKSLTGKHESELASVQQSTSRRYSKESRASETKVKSNYERQTRPSIVSSVNVSNVHALDHSRLDVASHDHAQPISEDYYSKNPVQTIKPLKTRPFLPQKPVESRATLKEDRDLLCMKLVELVGREREDSSATCDGGALVAAEFLTSVDGDRCFRKEVGKSLGVLKVPLKERKSLLPLSEFSDRLPNHIDVAPAVQMAVERSVGLGVVDQGDVDEVKESKSTELPKPWKVKTKPWKRNDASPLKDIEIFESKVVTPGVCDMDVTSPETGYLRIRCQGDEEFCIPSHVVDCFQCVDIILHGKAVFKENLEKTIRFPDIRAEVMESVLRFVFIEHLNNVKSAKYWGPDAPRLVFQFEELFMVNAKVEPDLVMELIHAAHFLGIKSLLSVAATMVAHHLADIPDVSSMVPDLAWCVAEQLTAQQLFDAEQRPDFLSLDLEQSSSSGSVLSSRKHRYSDEASDTSSNTYSSPFYQSTGDAADNQHSTVSMGSEFMEINHLRLSDGSHLSKQLTKSEFSRQPTQFRPSDGEVTSGTFSINELRCDESILLDEEDADCCVLSPAAKDEEEEWSEVPSKQFRKIGEKTTSAGWFVCEGEGILLAHEDGCCSYYDVANLEEKTVYRGPSTGSSRVWGDCWIVRAQGTDGRSNKFVVAASAGGAADPAFCSWDFYSRITAAYHSEPSSLPSPSKRRSGRFNSHDQHAPSVKEPGSSNMALRKWLDRSGTFSMTKFGGNAAAAKKTFERSLSLDHATRKRNVVEEVESKPSSPPLWWYRPCGPLLASAASGLKTISLFDIRDGDSVMHWVTQKSVAAMAYSSPLQWRNKSKLVLAEAESLSFWDVESLETKRLHTVNLLDKQMRALHVYNVDAECSGGVRQRLSSSDHHSDGILCTNEAVNVLDFRVPTGIAKKFPTLGDDIQSIFSDGDGVYTGATSYKGRGQGEGTTRQMQPQCRLNQWSIRQGKLMNVYAFPQLNTHSPITQVWGSSDTIMASSGNGLFMFEPARRQSSGQEVASVRDVLGPDDLQSPTFDCASSRLLLVSRGRPAMWCHWP